MPPLQGSMMCIEFLGFAPQANACHASGVQNPNWQGAKSALRSPSCETASRIDYDSLIEDSFW